LRATECATDFRRSECRDGRAEHIDPARREEWDNLPGDVVL
jgi:hypothetical protein